MTQEIKDKIGKANKILLKKLWQDPEYRNKQIKKRKEKVGKLANNWKGGLPKCIDCGKQLTSYTSKRCKKCNGKSNIFKQKCKKRAIGKKQSAETIKKRIIKNTGQKRTEEQKLRMKLAQPKGNKSPNWKGGISFEPYSIDWTETLRISIRERDKYTCQICGKKQGDKAHDVHHIDYDKKNCNPNNLIILCNSCHAKTNHNRQYWIEYFNIKMI